MSCAARGFLSNSGLIFVHERGRPKSDHQDSAPESATFPLTPSVGVEHVAVIKNKNFHAPK